jgi:hypothetical protein
MKLAFFCFESKEITEESCRGIAREYYGSSSRGWLKKLDRKQVKGSEVKK